MTWFTVLIAMHGRHHAFRTDQELARLLQIAVGEQLHGALQVRKQHGDLLALAFQGTTRGENFLREIGRGIGQRGRLLGGGGRCGSRGRGASGSAPDQDAAGLIDREALALDELVFEGF
jgi:hypothetical protein